MLFLFLLAALFQKKYVIAVILFVANLFVHKMTAGLSIIAGFLILLYRKLSLKVVVAGVIAISVTLLIIFSLPFIINIEDLSGRGLIFSAKLHWPSYSFLRDFKETIDPIWKVEIIFANLLLIAAIVYLMVKGAMDYKWLSFISILILLTIPYLEWSTLAISFRFFMVFIILCPILISCFGLKIKPVPSYLIMTVLIIAGTLYIYNYNPEKYDPPYGLYSHLAQEVKAMEDAQEIELIIGHKALAEYITFKTGIDVLPWDPEYEVHSDKLWRIATGLNSKSIEYFSNGVASKNNYRILSPSYFFIRENVWQQVIQSIKDQDEMLYSELLNWKNPHEIRPDYLLKGKSNR